MSHESSTTAANPASDSAPLKELTVPPVHRTTQLVMLLCIVGAFFLFWQVGNLLSIPRYRGFGVSLLRQPGLGGSVLTMIVCAVLVLGITVVAGIVARRYWLFAGPLAATAGLTAWTFRGGPGFYAFLADTPASANSGAFMVLALECLLFGVIFGGAWWMVYRIFFQPIDPNDELVSFVPTVRAAQVIASQTIFMALGVMLLVQTSDKQQAVFGVMASALIAAGLSRYFDDGKTPVQWCWVAPILVGTIGYLINGNGQGGQLALQTGQLTGTFAALSRPLPLDYASAGIFGSLVGIGMTSHQWDVVRGRFSILRGMD